MVWICLILSLVNLGLLYYVVSNLLHRIEKLEIIIKKYEENFIESEIDEDVET